MALLARSDGGATKRIPARLSGDPGKIAVRWPIVSGADRYILGPSFEEVVAALLQVDPTGITGQRAKRRDDEAEGDFAATGELSN